MFLIILLYFGYKLPLVQARFYSKSIHYTSNIHIHRITDTYKIIDTKE